MINLLNILKIICGTAIAISLIFAIAFGDISDKVVGTLVLSGMIIALFSVIAWVFVKTVNK